MNLEILSYIFLPVSSDSSSVLALCGCLQCVKSMRNSICRFSQRCKRLSRSSITSSSYFVSLCDVWEFKKKIWTSRNKVERGLKLESMNVGAQARLPVGL